MEFLRWLFTSPDPWDRQLTAGGRGNHRKLTPAQRKKQRARAKQRRKEETAKAYRLANPSPFMQAKQAQKKGRRALTQAELRQRREAARSPRRAS